MSRNQELIDNILDEFDFEKVHKAMVALDWVWVFAEDGVPTVGELRKAARLLLREAASRDVYYTGSGGFRVTKNADVLKLEFVLEQWEEEI
jgi:hypothetical protein